MGHPSPLSTTKRELFSDVCLCASPPLSPCVFVCVQMVHAFITTCMFVCLRQVLDMQMIMRTFDRFNTFLPLTVKPADWACVCVRVHACACTQHVTVLLIEWNTKTEMKGERERNMKCRKAVFALQL